MGWRWAVVVLAGFGLVACEAVPVTGRRQVVLMTDLEERALGVQAFRDVLARERPSPDPRRVARVNRVGRRIAAATGRPDLRWDFRVVERDEVNAACLPGGKVVVYTGLLDRVASDDELAAVLGHEVAHAVARHSAERLTQEMLADLGVSLVAELVGVKSRDPVLSAAVMAALGAGAAVGILLPYSRLHEAEADAMGLIFMADAGYDPRAALRFWQRMQVHQATRPQTPEFLSTHPAGASRIEAIAAALPGAMARYRPIAPVLSADAP